MIERKQDFLNATDLHTGFTETLRACTKAIQAKLHKFPVGRKKDITMSYL